MVLRLFILSVLFVGFSSCSSLSHSTLIHNSTPKVEKKYYNQTSFIEKAKIEREINPDNSVAKEENSLKSYVEEIEAIDDFSNSPYVSNLLCEAESYIGTPYRYGGTTRRGIDCSAFTQSVFGEVGFQLPRVSAAQATLGEKISLSEAQKGDLVFFATGRRGRVSHVGIVHDIDENGEVYFIHSGSSTGVTITPLSHSYWQPRFLFVKRVLDADKDEIFEYAEQEDSIAIDSNS